MAGSVIKCPLCKLGSHGVEALTDHLERHSPRVLAEEFVNRYVCVSTPCGKKRFPSREHAERALALNTLSLNPLRREIRSYKCDRCSGSWHLTSQEAKS